MMAGILWFDSKPRWKIQAALRLCIICLGAILAAARADEMENPLENNPFLGYIEVDLSNWPDRILQDSRDTFFRPDNLCALLLAGGASIAMNQHADKEIAEHFEEHSALDGFADESLNVIGSPATHLAATGLWYVLSAENKDQFNKKRAWTMMTALAVTDLTTAGLKLIRNNENPNGGNWAWPSGHTSSSFTVASVLDEFYGPKVGIPAYVLASLVAYRMMDTGEHWASDVVFGATLGWVVGHTIAGKHKMLEKLEVAGFKILPYASAQNGTVIGISLIKRF